MSIKLNKLVGMALILAVVYSLAVAARIDVYKSNRLLAGSIFTQECAFHYYFTKLIAKNGILPAVDFRIQFPEGFKTDRSESMFMEYFAGYVYRIFLKFADFDRFINFFVIIFSSLSALAVFLIARALFENNIAAFFSGIFYAVSWPAVARTMGFVYLKENFALPIIFFQIYFFIKYLKSGKKLNIIISSLLFILALASWHFTRFYFLVVSFYAFLNFVFLKDRIFLKGFTFLTLAGVLASFGIPFLRNGAFFISYPMCLAYSVILTSFFKNFSKVKRLILIILAFAFLVIIFIPYSKEMQSYSHVYGMLFYKMKFLGIRPQEPASLPFEVRELWVKPFHTPDFKNFASDFLALILLSLVPILFYLRSFLKSNASHIKFLMYLVAVTFGMYLLSTRLRSFFVFAISIFSGGLIYFAGKRIMKLITLAILIIMGLSSFVITSNKRIMPLVSVSTPDTIRWIIENTKENDVILSTPFYSTEICAYAQRPIVLHPKYETKDIRDKIKRFANTLFGDSEEDFYRLCGEWSVKYFVFPKGTYTNEDEYSWRYFTDKLEFDKNSLALKFEALPVAAEYENKGRYQISVSTGFDKPNLKYFDLIYQNKEFNIYKVKS